MEIAREFLRRANHVAVVTRSRSGYIGERLLFGQLKVYYLPRNTHGIETSNVTLWFSAPQFYRILSRERITHVHGHQTTSGIAYELCAVAKVMGLPVFWTEHSLFGLATVSSVHLNLSMSSFLHVFDQVIAVSEVQRDNLHKRLGRLTNVTVVPNGIDPDKFVPITADATGYPTLVAVTRFERRRGGQMLPEIIQRVCEADATAKWIVVGGGKMFGDVKSVLKSCQFASRITLLGPIDHGEIAAVLQRGHFFVNCSLTDAFCMSIVEAAASGLYVVSTDVGGIPEVLPREARTLCAPSVRILTAEIVRAIREKREYHRENAERVHELIARTMSWKAIAEQLLAIYDTRRLRNSCYWEMMQPERPGRSFACLIYFALLYVTVAVCRWLL
jgi:phosphatidylinositol glycan class A protein